MRQSKQHFFPQKRPLVLQKMCFDLRKILLGATVSFFNFGVMRPHILMYLCSCAMESIMNASNTGHEDLAMSRMQPSAAGATSAWPDYLVGQPDNPVRVMVVEDDSRERMVISQEIMRDHRTIVVAQASCLRDARKLIRNHEFDVMLVDLNLGNGNEDGLELIDVMKSLRPSAEAIVVSVVETEEQVLRAFEVGATGYVVKNSWFGNYVQAVLQVANGGASITPILARRLLQRFDKNIVVLPKPCNPINTVPDHISARERMVLRMVANGYTSAEIANNMEISATTVNAHIKSIYNKLQVHSRAQVVRYALTHGLI